MRENVQLLLVCVANRQAGQLMVAHQGAARSWHTRAKMADSAHLSKDRAPSPPFPKIETTFTLSSFSFHRGKLQLKCIATT